MEHERRPEIKERLSLAEKRELIASLFRKNWDGGKRLPFMPEVVSTDGLCLEKTPGAAPGKVAIENVEMEDGMIRSIRTGTGFIAIGRAEVMTKELTGCMGVLVRGLTKDNKPLTGLFHMTPTSKLAWGNFKSEEDEKRWGHDTRKHASKTIVEALLEADADLEKCSATFVRTAGLPPDEKRYNGYSENHESKKADDLVECFLESGLKATSLEPLNLETATIYWSPEAPNELMTVGETRIPNQEGGVDEPSQNEKTVVSQIVALAG